MIRIFAMTTMDGFAEVIGAVFGQMLGNQVVRETGKTVATVAAAVGAFSGYEIDNRRR